MPTTVSHSALTPSGEDYLKAVYCLSAEDRPASTSEIATRLELTAASVTGMLKRLSEQGLLEHFPHKGARLTPRGREAALRMVRRHRLIESYLVRFLGFSWDTVHDEAERLEHAVSDALVERMATALGHPTADPHGDPIPDQLGAVPEVACTPLSSIPAGHTVEIRRVAGQDPERLRYLATLGLRPGVLVTVLDCQPFEGPITVLAGGERRAIGRTLSDILLCGPASSETREGEG